MNKKRSTNIEIQQFFSLQITLQTLSDTNRTYTHRSPSKEQVTNFQSYKLAYISDYIIYLEKHICRTTALSTPPEINAAMFIFIVLGQ